MSVRHLFRGIVRSFPCTSQSALVAQLSDSSLAVPAAGAIGTPPRFVFAAPAAIRLASGCCALRVDSLRPSTPPFVRPLFTLLSLFVCLASYEGACSSSRSRSRSFSHCRILRPPSLSLPSSHVPPRSFPSLSSLRCSLARICLCNLSAPVRTSDPFTICCPFTLPSIRQQLHLRISPCYLS